MLNCLMSSYSGQQDLLGHLLRVKPVFSTTPSHGATVKRSTCAGLSPLPAQLLVGQWHPGLLPQDSYWQPGGTGSMR